MDNHDYIEINRMLVRQNESLINALLEVVKALAPAPKPSNPFGTTFTPMFGGHMGGISDNKMDMDEFTKTKMDLIPEAIDKDGKIDFFKLFPESQRENLEEVLKRAPEILDEVKKISKAKEKEDEEWKEKLKGNKK